MDKTLYYRYRLSQMADLVGCPEDMILRFYTNCLKENTWEEAYKACYILLQVWNEHYVPLMNKLRARGILKQVGYKDL